MTVYEILAICISAVALAFSIPALILSIKRISREKTDLAIELYPSIHPLDSNHVLRVDFTFYNRSDVSATILYIKLLKHAAYACHPTFGRMQNIYINAHDHKSFTAYFYDTGVKNGDLLTFTIKLKYKTIKIKGNVQ